FGEALAAAEARKHWRISVGNPDGMSAEETLELGDRSPIVANDPDAIGCRNLTSYLVRQLVAKIVEDCGCLRRNGCRKQEREQREARRALAEVESHGRE